VVVLQAISQQDLICASFFIAFIFDFSSVKHAMRLQQRPPARRHPLHFMPRLKRQFSFGVFSHGGFASAFSVFSESALACNNLFGVFIYINVSGIEGRRR
jgi:hypothetical protein